MPIFELSKDVIFPDPDLADPSGILGVGGDLQPDRLLLAYQSGIFPWFNEGDPIVWWSPDPRTVLYPPHLRVSHSMKKVLREKKFRITFDEDFEAVILCCKAQKRPGQKGTWITKEMAEAYIKLHQLGYAHSVEVWKDNLLAGGLYGVSLGNFFAGESMFSKVTNASKVAFIGVTRILEKLNFTMIDCQVHTNHLATLGAEEISRERYLSELEQCLEHPTLKGNWSKMKVFEPLLADFNAGKTDNNLTTA